MTWTDRMYDALRARSRRLDPVNYPGGCPPHVGEWMVEVDRVYDALAYLIARRFRFAFSGAVKCLLTSATTSPALGVWRAEYLSQGVQTSMKAGPGWYATKNEPAGDARRLTVMGFFADEAECRQWCEQKNAEEHTT